MLLHVGGKFLPVLAAEVVAARAEVVADIARVQAIARLKRLEIAKLVAIFRLSNALDKSKRQKLRLNKIKITNDKLEIKVDTADNALLEKWAFEECAGFFKEVFGLSPELHIRSNLL